MDVVFVNAQSVQNSVVPYVAHGFNSWIRSEICGSDALSQMLRISAESLLATKPLEKESNDPNKQHKSVIPTFLCDLFCVGSESKLAENKSDHLLKHKFILRTSDSYYKWPGFYAGITDKFSQKLSVDSTQSNLRSTDSNLRSNFLPSVDYSKTRYNTMCQIYKLETRH